MQAAALHSNAFGTAMSQQHCTNGVFIGHSPHRRDFDAVTRPTNEDR